MILIYMLLAFIFLAIAYVVVKKDNYVEPKKEPKVPKPTPVAKKPLPKKSPSPKPPSRMPAPPPPSRRPAPPSPNKMADGYHDWTKWCYENLLDLKQLTCVSSYGRNMINGYSMLNGTVKFEYDPVATDGKYYCYYNTEKHISVGFDNLKDFSIFYNEHLTELKEQLLLHDINKDFD